jgi:hypothetical protein
MIREGAMKSWLRWPALVLFGLVVSTATVLSQTETATETTQVIPRVAFPHKDRSYTVTLSYPALTGLTTPEYWLIFNDAPAVKACLHASASCPVRALPLDGHQVQFTEIPGSLAGVHKLKVQAGGTQLPEAQVTFSLVGRSVPLVVSLIALAAIVLVVGLLLRSGGSRTLGNRKAVSMARAMFVDPETSTYSLAKLQFYVWTFAGLAGWLYLSFAKSLVQGSWTLSDVPSNLPGIVAISVGTGIISSGVASVAGNKGSGDVEPSWADFITSGGVVAPERLQYMLWTMVGGVAFLFNTLMISPAEIDTLPAIPQGFITLMGISAGGYLGGKLARGAGPNIRNVVNNAPAAGAAPILTVEGTGLASRGATFFLAHPVGAPDMQITATVLTDANQSVIDAATGVATKLALQLPAGTQAFTAGDHYRFTIVNPDGEKSVWEFVAI